MNKSMKILALIMAVVMMASVTAGCGKKKNQANTQPGTAQTGTLMSKPEAKNVVQALNKENTNVDVVKEQNGTNKNVFSDTAEKKFWVSENTASGALESVTYKLAYTEDTRSAKLDEFFAQIKVIMMTCDTAMTSERADELVKYFKEADRGYGVESVRIIDNENGFNYAIHYLSSPAQVDFIVGVNTFK